jgi:hypothetical protein
MKNRQGSLTPHQYEAIARMVRSNNLFAQIGVDLGSNIFGGDLKAGIFIKGLKGYEDGFFVDYHSQEVRGSTDEKLPFIVLNILEHYTHPTILVLDGKGWREGAISWAEKSVGERLIEIHRSIKEFNNWFLARLEE